MGHQTVNQEGTPVLQTETVGFLTPEARLPSIDTAQKNIPLLQTFKMSHTPSLVFTRPYNDLIEFFTLYKFHVDKTSHY